MTLDITIFCVEMQYVIPMTIGLLQQWRFIRLIEVMRNISEDEEVRTLFLKIYDVCEEKGYLKHSAGQGWFNRVTHFGDFYDCIQIDTMGPMITQYVQANYERRRGGRRKKGGSDYADD